MLISPLAHSHDRHQKPHSEKARVRIENVLNRLFSVDEVNGGYDCPTYLYRWRLLKIGWLGIYLQHFVGDDWSLDLHDHPRRFISFGLWGRYLEETPHGSRWYVAPWIRTFPAKHIHRIIQPKHCWTLAFCLKIVRKWGFWHRFDDGSYRLILWRDFVNGSARDIAERMKNCP